MTESGQFPLLELINDAADVRQLDQDQLNQLTDELRAFLIQSVGQTGGHLASGLGTVELTIALHHVFNTPTDNLIWDVGHQSYPHKILTGRRKRMDSLRQYGGLAGPVEIRTSHAPLPTTRRVEVGISNVVRP